jgi:hypothetical protein
VAVAVAVAMAVAVMACAHEGSPIWNHTVIFDPHNKHEMVGGMGTAKQEGSKCCELTSGLRLIMARKLPRPLKIVGTALIA